MSLASKRKTLGNKISPDFNKVMSGVSEDTSPLVEELAKSCGK